MIKYIKFFSLLLFVALLSYATDVQKTYSVKVEMSGVASNKGMVLLALHKDKKTFLKKVAPFMAGEAPINELSSFWVFKDIEPGEYSISVFHDENNNKDLDGVFKIPKEYYGFSNNAWKKFGPPKYEATVFSVTDTDVVQTIELRSAIEVFKRKKKPSKKEQELEAKAKAELEKMNKVK